jgi:ADP-heptose:LPS heptosyltransferase
MHMAAAVGVPTVGLFGPSPATHYAPWGPRNAVVQTDRDWVSLMSAPGFDHRTTDTLMDGLTVDAAEAAVRGLWQRLAGDAA